VVYFVDTSALAKRYVSETGSAWLRALLDPAAGAETFLVRVTAVELVAGLTRRQRGGSLAPHDTAVARNAFRGDLASEYQLVEVTASLADRAMSLAEAHGLRGYDAIQLAAALSVNEFCVAAGLSPLLLISSDVELNAAARAEGLTVDDPNGHP
jgi:uncharacterized protein